MDNEFQKVDTQIDYNFKEFDELRDLTENYISENTRQFKRHKDEASERFEKNEGKMKRFEKKTKGNFKTAEDALISHKKNLNIIDARLVISFVN